MNTSDKILTCSEFRALRDFYQQERRAVVLPALKQRKTVLLQEIDETRQQMEDMGIKPTKGLPWKIFQANLQHNHKREALYTKALELSWDYQDVCGQVAVIEADAERGADVPAWFAENARVA